MFFEKFPTRINYKFPEEFYNSPMEGGLSMQWECI
jgi:hypothetical protein